MRIVAVPILRNRWAYYCHSSLPSTSRLTQFVDWSSKKWDQLGTADDGTWKKKLYVKGNHVVNQLDYQEWFLKGVPIREHLKEPVEKATIEYTSLLNEKEIHTHLQQFLKERGPYHYKYMKYSMYWVPVSCLFVVVPLIPNIPLAYNLFRLYSHYKAYKGVQHIEALMQNNTLDFATNSTMDHILLKKTFASSHDVVFPSDIVASFTESPSKPNLQRLEDDVDGVLDLQTISQLAHELDMGPLELELKRARFQILSEVAHQRFAQSTSKGSS
ncbi:mitochondrial K+-H+ exchange-related-domain-containing protein [Radiomyces spectabilis]|uniref:mitochondrial K+-H+ exchange-related-domain-containing protein n=1 Tax=Radiomyces spectabilis TaxID=64574 RepID=UPI00221F79BB|nr:mitochondrial K+-H+ exchange-related-domain-containing protein [Radiomyces spectabilis]KAI8384531.1 mitochondrial K+-H+ exchange-related-domain-containing protein [Radiomyces spectabilis]